MNAIPAMHWQPTYLTNFYFNLSQLQEVPPKFQGENIKAPLL
jgi:hypothetical protein